VREKPRQHDAGTNVPGVFGISAAPALAGRAHLRVLDSLKEDLARTLGIAPGLLGLAFDFTRNLGDALFLFEAEALDLGEALGFDAGGGLLGLTLGTGHGDGFALRASLLHDRVIRTRPCLETLEERLLGGRGIGLTISEAAVVRVLQG